MGRVKQWMMEQQEQEELNMPEHHFDPEWIDIITPALYDISEELSLETQLAMNNKASDQYVFALACEKDYDIVHELMQEHIQDNIPF